MAISVQPQHSGSAIILERSRKKQSNLDAYSIRMDSSSVIISADADDGLFYGIISFLQLVASAQKRNDRLKVACWNLEDALLYQWRGFMLDESRHFFGKEKVKFLLDWLALVGGIGNFSDSTAPAKYYIQKDIKEIVAYAAERKIAVIPEIDMPGHVTVANKAYPMFSGGGSVSHPAFTFHPDMESTYQFLTDVLRETDVLFPSDMIHLGRDEVSF